MFFQYENPYITIDLKQNSSIKSSGDVDIADVAYYFEKDVSVSWVKSTRGWVCVLHCTRESWLCAGWSQVNYSCDEINVNEQVCLFPSALGERSVHLS